MIETTINAIAKDRWFWLWFYAAMGLLVGAGWLSVAGVLGNVLFFCGVMLFVGTFIWFGKKHWRAGEHE